MAKKTLGWVGLAETHVIFVLPHCVHDTATDYLIVTLI